MAVGKRKLSASAPENENETPVDPSDELMFLCLGGGNEVGRSCHILQYKGKTVMLDAGMHPAYEGIAALPYFDDFDLSTVDVLLISHFHVDHAASLPYVLARTNFRGRVFMTHPTKAIYRWLIQDTVRVGNASSSDQRTQLFTEADHFATFPRIEAIDFYTTHTVSSIRFTPYPAGHVLGAAMFLIEIAGLKILFTGDYSREDDRHLVSAKAPPNVKIDVLITESTYGIASHVPRVERETAMMKTIISILNRGGKVLMPVFALGRAQELLLILDEYWHRHPEYQRIPIFYASSLARKCLTIYSAYIGAMNDNIKRLFQERMAEAERAGITGRIGGPWDFQHIRSLKNLERFDDAGSCVVMASPGMLQNGVSRELLERWAPNERNGVVITGYSVEGTMAKELLKEPESIPAVTGNRGGAVLRAGRFGGGEAEKPMIPRRCSVSEFSFAAHVDGPENREFIEETGAPVIILVHGEKHNMMRLKSKLLSLNNDKAQKARIYSPANTEGLRIPFRTDKTARVVGRLAQEAAPPSSAGDDLDKSSKDQQMSGVLVQNDFKLSLMAPEDLREYAGLTTTTISCRQRITLQAAGVDLIRWALESTFGAITELNPAKTADEQAAEAGTVDEAKLNGQGQSPADINGQTQTNGDSKGPFVDDEITRVPDRTFLVMDAVTVRCAAQGQVTVEWEGDMLRDGIADAVLAVLYSVETSPAAVLQSSRHQHDHDDHSEGEASQADIIDLTQRPHANITPQQRFERLCMFLEAQFGPNIEPIMQPPPVYNGKLAVPIKPESVAKAEPVANGSDVQVKSESAAHDGEDADQEESEAELAERETAELARLTALGVPVPGIRIRVDKYEARVWLETLTVESASTVFAQRVRAVVERAVETIAPLWT